MWVPISRVSDTGGRFNAGPMLEKLSEYFYDPVVFWTAPLALVAVAACWRRIRARRLRRLTKTPPGNGPEDPQPSGGVAA